MTAGRTSPTGPTVATTRRQLRDRTRTRRCPAASGPHWGTPARLGRLLHAAAESQSIHNLEHGGIVIWYDPEALDRRVDRRLTTYVQSQNAIGLSGRYKFILSPWGGSEPLPSPVVATAWRWILELETADTDAIDEFARAHYGRVAGAERRSRAVRLTPN